MAVAENVHQARKIAKSSPAYTFGTYKQDRTPDVKLGKPDRVVVLPAAEWHEWSN